ncbi:hypothetical protein C5167_039368 [Papaver somniferum]|uniref:non-specific serine/threonine protein kinase n=1 Tax=Papaver somniferum TaxID=3469 RepID=A0A4Y7IG26_PAPSO|nr:hypothetical protein C5167_039368 [Papaver somniferum]
MNSDGNIIIFSGTKDVIWSSNSSMTVKNPTAQLLDTGNFVLRDGKRESYVWQSFDYPCDSMIAGMKLGWSLKENRNWSMSSWKNADDPSPGDFTYKVDHSGLPEFILQKGSEILYRSGNYDGIIFGGDPEIKSTPVYDPMFVYHANEMYYIFEDIYPEKSRFVLNQTGSIDHLKWDDINQEWVVVITLLRDSCDNYDPCGAHGTCNINNVPPCGCLKGFTPKSPQQYSDAFNPSAGCLRSSPLACSREEGFVKFTKVKFPDNSQVLDTTNNCEKECLARCSCSAYAITDVASCIVCSGDLHDIRSYNDGWSTNIYVRMSANYLRDIHVESSNKKKIIVSVVLGISLLGLTAINFLIIRQKRRARRGGININNHDRDYNMNGSQEEDLELHAFHLATIETATNYFFFANKIGEGGFGLVYKGQLSTGQKIAVKRLSTHSGQGISEFKNEVKLIAKLQHRNLVRLLGCCIQGGERMLIYEYMPNKSLDNFIFDRTRDISLNWLKCFEIIVGIARGLMYLHEDSRLRIIHRDLKASNVLLDGDLNPKISDFGAAKTFRGDQTEGNTRRVFGTYGYMSPEYTIDGLFSMKSDVYSFGVVVLEIISGKKNRGFTHPDHDLNLLGHVWKLWNEDKAIEVMNSNMETPFHVPISQILRCIHVGLLCVQQRPEDKPAM